MGIYLLSDRSLVSSVSMDPVFELEDLLTQTCGATILAPKLRGISRWAQQSTNLVNQGVSKVLSNTTGFYEWLDCSLPQELNVLLVIALYGSRLDLLSSIPDWRQRFDIVAAYVFDAWSPEIYPRYTGLLNHLFVPLSEMIEPLQNHWKIPVSLLPFGADVLVHGSDSLERPIDLISYGRVPHHHHHAFTQAFNQPDSTYFYLRLTPRSSENCPQQPYEQRRDREDNLQLYQLLRRTKLALAYDPLYGGMRTFPFSFVTLRWFQCGAAGCAIVGKRPTTPLADELLDWHDATIELPDDPSTCLEVIQDLLQDGERLQAIHQRNYVKNLSRHDWRLRIRTLLETLGLALPTVLAEQLTQLDQRQNQPQYSIR